MQVSTKETIWCEVSSLKKTILDEWQKDALNNFVCHESSWDVLNLKTMQPKLKQIFESSETKFNNAHKSFFVYMGYRSILITNLSNEPTQLQSRPPQSSLSTEWQPQIRPTHDSVISIATHTKTINAQSHNRSLLGTIWE